MNDWRFEDCFDPKSKMKYQGDAITSVLKLFDGVSKDIGGVTTLNRSGNMAEANPIRNPHLITGSRLLRNLNEVQLENEIYQDVDLRGNNFCVEMETGTGKTYVYLRTIMELYFKFKIKKFIIVVPSVAIRKGVEKSIKQLEEDFAGWYGGIKLSDHYFVFDSHCSVDTVSAKLVESDVLSIMITTMQSITGDNKRLKGGSEAGRAAGEKRNVWEDLSYIKPVVIVDEPQRVMGKVKKPSKAAEAIAEVKPSFSLHYSATPQKDMFNTVYRLSSFDAFDNELVKGIEVKTIFGQVPKDEMYVRFIGVTPSLKARIEIFKTEQGSSWSKAVQVDVSKESSLFTLSGRLPQYKNVFIAENPHKNKPLKLSVDGDIIELAQHDSTYKQDADSVKRIQMRIALKSHFDKQFKFLKEGKRIKVLSLFFIDSVSKIRDDKAADGRGEYLRLFDEEYLRIIKSGAYAPLFEQFAEFFPKYKENLLVREGYFARDKAGKEVDAETDDEGDGKDKKSKEDIERGIGLILDGKDKLIKFDEPLAFIFSHSALREGWDNPNIFTLCTLKSGGSEVAKKQEIGRGLRLALNDGGERIYNSDVNRITVVVNDNYERFAETLQADFNEKAGFNKDEVTYEVLQKVLKSAGVPKGKVTPQLVEALKTELFMGGVITDKNLVKKDADIKKVKFSNDTLVEHATKIADKFESVMKERGTKKIKVSNGDLERTVNGLTKHATEPEFKALMDELYDRIKQRTFYSVEIDNQKFIEDTAKSLNEQFGDKSITNVFNIGDGELKAKKDNTFEMTSGVHTQSIEDIDETGAKSDYEIVNYIMFHTNLPRLAIVKILAKFSNREILNSQDWLDRVTWRISELFTEAKGKQVNKYNIIDGYVFDQDIIFHADTIDDEADLEESKKRFVKSNSGRTIHKYYKMDGAGGEYDFAMALEKQEGIVLWTKFKKGKFTIDTPYGEYTPDWAIVAKDESGKPQLYFIVETKIDKNWSGDNSIKEDEQAKIKCGILHFEALGGVSKFDWVNKFSGTIDSFMNKFKFTQGE